MMADIDDSSLPWYSSDRYVAYRADEVWDSADTLDELWERIDRSGVPWSEIVIAFVERSDVVRV